MIISIVAVVGGLLMCFVMAWSIEGIAHLNPNLIK